MVHHTGARDVLGLIHLHTICPKTILKRIDKISGAPEVGLSTQLTQEGRGAGGKAGMILALGAEMARRRAELSLEHRQGVRKP